MAAVWYGCTLQTITGSRQWLETPIAVLSVYAYRCFCVDESALALSTPGRVAGILVVLNCNTGVFVGLPWCPSLRQPYVKTYYGGRQHRETTLVQHVKMQPQSIGCGMFLCYTVLQDAGLASSCLRCLPVCTSLLSTGRPHQMCTCFHSMEV